jgi:hypothetical protein
MLKIAIASLFTKNKKYAAAVKIQGAMGEQYDGFQPYTW